MGSRHAENAARGIPGAELIAVCDINKKSADKISEQLEAKYCYYDYGELLKNDEVEGVIIANDTTEHCRTICDAGSADKHIFCEKPIGVNLEELQKIEKSLNRKTEIIFQVGFSNRFDPSYIHAKKRVNEGCIGKPILIRCVSRDPVDYIEFNIKYAPNSAGFIFDMSVHDLDLACWFAESRVKSVYTLGGVYAFKEFRKFNDVDNYLITLQFENGVIAQLEGSRISTCGYVKKMEVFGTEGEIKIGPVANYQVQLSDKYGIRTEKESYPWFLEGFGFGQAYLNELREFVDCILNGKASSVGAEQGATAVRLAFLAQESLSKRKEVLVENI